MNIIWYIFYPLTLGLIFFTYAFFRWPKYAIAGLIIAKPIIDVSWDYHILLDINFLKLYAGLFVILGVIYIIVKRVPILTSRHINIPSPLLKVPSSVEGMGAPTTKIPSPLMGEDKGGGETDVQPESQNSPPEPQDGHPEPCPEQCHPEPRPELVSRVVSGSTQNSPFHRFSQSPFHLLTILWLIFLVLNVVSIFIISDTHLLLGKINYFLRILTGFVALIMFAYVFDFKKDKKIVLSIFVIAGIFPILLWLIPVVLGNPIISTDPLRRIMGPYQNFWNFNFYATQTLICCLAWFSLSHRNRTDTPSLHFSDTPKRRFSRSPKSIIIMLMLFISVIMIYKCYSKTGWITLIVIFLIWFVLQRKFIVASIFVFITAIIVFVNPFAADFQKTFSSEINYVTHVDNTGETVFRGRLSRWGIGMQRFIELPVINKLFGAKKSIGNPENDYLRVLWQNGILGFLSYITLLCLTGYFLISRYAGTKEVVMLVGILVFIVFFISGIGSYSMYLPNLQWFMWGMVGFVIGKQRTKSMGIKASKEIR